MPVIRTPPSGLPDPGGMMQPIVAPGAPVGLLLQLLAQVLGPKGAYKIPLSGWKSLFRGEPTHPPDISEIIPSARPTVGRWFTTNPQTAEDYARLWGRPTPPDAGRGGRVLHTQVPEHTLPPMQFAEDFHVVPPAIRATAKTIPQVGDAAAHDLPLTYQGFQQSPRGGFHLWNLAEDVPQLGPAGTTLSDDAVTKFFGRSPMP